MILFSSPSHNMLSLQGTRICPPCDGDEVFGGTRLIKLLVAQDAWEAMHQSESHISCDVTSMDMLDDGIRRYGAIDAAHGTRVVSGQKETQVLE